MKNSYIHYDAQLLACSHQLQKDVGMKNNECTNIATTIAADIRFLPLEVKSRIESSTPVQLSSRIEELDAFQGFMDFANSIHEKPYLTRAQVITQNYICFVYLGEACFRVLSKQIELRGSVTQRCCRFLTENPVRAFRNAIAHANWCYKEDCSGLNFWARKGSEENELLTKFSASQLDIDFWQTLSRAVAYVAYTQIQT